MRITLELTDKEVVALHYWQKVPVADDNIAQATGFSDLTGHLTQKLAEAAHANPTQCCYYRGCPNHPDYYLD